MKEMMDANQAEADPNLKEMLARMDANRKDDQEEMKEDTHRVMKVKVYK
jgi:hypothetical protein